MSEEERKRLLEIADEVEAIARTYTDRKPEFPEVHPRQNLRYDLSHAAHDIRKAAKRLSIRAQKVE